ncbi:MAG: hypothetical protein KGJ43_01040 [Acidobacteriota bacterium]|nr:hypothetical protein [Acidobacteriota bacterium]
MAASSIYWGTETEPTLAFANLDGSGGANIATPGATVNNITGVAIDAATGKVYWANHGANKISFANLDALVITATNSAGQKSAPQKLSFTIVR